MAVLHYQKTVGTTETSVYPSAPIPPGGYTVQIYPVDGTVYWGKTGVTTADGMPILQDQPQSTPLDDFYLVASTNIDVRFVITRVEPNG